MIKTGIYVMRPIDPTNPTSPQVPNIRAEVPIDMTIPPLALEYGYSMLDTLHERIGETWRPPVLLANEEHSTTASSGWARLIGEQGSHHNDNFFRHGENYNYTFGGMQVGLDILADEKANDTLDTAGVYIGYGQIRSDVKGAFSGKAGTVDMDAYTLGIYWTHYAPSNCYTDIVLQGTWYKANANSAYGQQIKPDGFGMIVSFESGFAFRLNNDWDLEPQAQLAYQNVSFDDAHDQFGFVSFSDGESLRGRLGARLSRTWNTEGQAKPSPVTA